MKNALILHGTGANSSANWFPWLKKELEKKDWKVWIPNLPRANRPNIKRYNKFIFGNKDWKFDEETFLIGHSSGAVAILGLLQSLPENVVINTAIFIGSFKDNLGRDDLSDLFKKPFDFEEIKRHARNFIFIHSDDDPICPLEHAKYLCEKLNGKLVVKHGQKHFSYSRENPQFKKLPILLELMD